MRTSSDEKTDDLDLDLPALDGEEEAESDVAHDIPDFHDDGGDAFDDSTGEDAPVGDLHVVEGAEGPDVAGGDVAQQGVIVGRTIGSGWEAGQRQAGAPRTVA